jgi:hypothetical protein
MMKYRIRFNKSRGNPGRGTREHVWRVFEETDREYLFKNLDISVPIKSEREKNGDDYNIFCYGVLKIDRDTSTAIISESEG